VASLSKDQPVLDYNVHVKTDRGAISSVRYHIPMRNVNLDALVTPKSADLKQFAADTLSGRVTSTGHADLGDAISYTALVHVQRIDLNGLARVAVNPGEKPITVSGELSAEISVSGKGTGPAALDALGAFGNVQVTKGDLFRVPVLKDIVSAIDLGDAATVSDASCSFNLAGRKIQVSDAVVNSPALGVKGGGVVGLDGSLDLNVIANVLSDWEHHIKEIDNPVANVVGSVAGAVQRGVNKVTETLLYQLHVSGTVDKPAVKVITAPALRRK
jgi:hypothetical protein